MDINPEEVINNLSAQIGNLTTENVVLKMALAKLEQELADAEPAEAPVSPTSNSAGEKAVISEKD